MTELDRKENVAGTVKYTRYIIDVWIPNKPLSHPFPSSDASASVRGGGGLRRRKARALSTSGPIASRLYNIYILAPHNSRV